MKFTNRHPTEGDFTFAVPAGRNGSVLLKETEEAEWVAV